MPATPSSAAGSPPASDASGQKSDTGWFAMLKQTVKDFSEDNALRLAAAMACYIMLALAPMLVISLKLVSMAFQNNPQRAEQVVEGQVDQLVGPAGADAISEMIKNANKDEGGTLATVISLAIVLFSASGVFVSLQDALNTI